MDGHRVLYSACSPAPAKVFLKGPYPVGLAEILTQGDMGIGAY